MQRVRAYIRVSTEEQAEEGFSIPAQRQRLAAFCQSQGWCLAAWYVEEGRSARDLKRPELQRLLADLQPDEIVLVYRLDRLTRSVLDLYALLRRFEQAGAAFRSVSEVYDTTTAIGRLFITLVAALAQWERENLAERVRMGMAQAAAQGRRMGGTAPFGYDLADGRLRPNPAEAPVVRRFFECYLQGESVRSLAARAAQQGLRTKSGKPWTDFAVSYLLRNPAYAGRLRWGGARAPVPADAVAALVSPDTFAAVQARLAERKAAPPRVASGVYPLAGLLRCGACGAPMRGRRRVRRRAGGAPAVTRYYACTGREQRRSCSVHRIGAEALEAAVVAGLARSLPPCRADLAQALAAELAAAGEDAELARLRAERQQVAARRARWLDAFEQGALDTPALQERLRELASREAGLAARIAALEGRASGDIAAAEFRRRLGDLPWVWERATPAERKQILQAFVREVTFRPGAPPQIRWREGVAP